MIKIFSEKDIKQEYIDSNFTIDESNEGMSNDPNCADYPIDELDYLLLEHPSESFILYKNRLIECDEKFLKEIGALPKEDLENNLEIEEAMEK